MLMIVSEKGIRSGALPQPSRVSKTDKLSELFRELILLTLTTLYRPMHQRSNRIWPEKPLTNANHIWGWQRHKNRVSKWLDKWQQNAIKAQLYTPITFIGKKDGCVQSTHISLYCHFSQHGIYQESDTADWMMKTLNLCNFSNCLLSVDMLSISDSKGQRLSDWRQTRHVCRATLHHSHFKTRDLQ